MRILIFTFCFLICGVALAGILPTSRGGTGANLTPAAGAVITSTASGMAVSTSLKALPSGFTIVLPAGSTLAAPLTIIGGSTMATPQKGAIESNGTHLYWTNSSGTRFIIK